MITRSILIPDDLEWRFGWVRSVEQIPRTQTHEGGARDHTTSVQTASRPECLCHNLQSRIHSSLRDLIQVSADNHLRPFIELACNQFRGTLPVAMGNFLERCDRYDRIRVG